MRVITEEQILAHVGIGDILPAIEKAFAALDREDSAVFDVARGSGTDPNHFFAVKSGRDGSIPLIGVKMGSYCPSNLAKGLAAHTSTTVLIDDETGAARAVVQANYLNGMRTAASNGAAAKRLAREDSQTLGVVGWGAQSVFEVEAVAHVRPIRRVVAAGRSAASGELFKAEVLARTGLQVELAEVEQVVRAADILVTATPARAPLFNAAWVRPGTHVAAMGADNVGKQEIPLDLMRTARVFVDEPNQAARIGECQHAVAAGILDLAALSERTLGGLVGGRCRGRTDAAEITLFDSSGLAIQDIAAACAAIEAIDRAEGAARG